MPLVRGRCAHAPACFTSMYCWGKRQRTRTGRGPHDEIQRNGRGPGADRTRAWPFLPLRDATWRRWMHGRRRRRRIGGGRADMPRRGVASPQAHPPAAAPARPPHGRVGPPRARAAPPTADPFAVAVAPCGAMALRAAGTPRVGAVAPAPGATLS
eukprot:gene19298-biopygen17488